MRQSEGGVKEIASTAELRKQKKYWIKKMLELNEEEPLLAPSISKADAPFVTYTVKFDLPTELGDRVIQMSRTSKDALYVIMLAALKSLVHKYTEGHTVTIAYPTLIQGTDTDNAATQWIPLIDNRPDQQTFREWLNALKDTYTEAVQNEDFLIDKAILDMKIIHERDYTFLRHTKFMLEGLHEGTKWNKDTDVTGLLMYAKHHESNIHFNLHGSSQYFSETLLEQLKDQYIHVLQELVNYPDRIVAKSSWVYEEERIKLVNEYASGELMLTADHVIQMFEDQVIKTPNSQAIATSNEATTYANLEQRMNRWANALIHKGVQSCEVVALFLDRSVETAAAILAVLKSGACFLPIDIHSPDERTRFILADAGVKRIVTHQKYIEKDIFSGFELLTCEELDTEKEVMAPMCTIHEHSPAYIIYTSGTTGMAKGVAVPHRGLTNSISWRKAEYSLDEHDHTLQLFSYSFDGFMTAFFTPLVSGASLFMANDIQVKDPLRLKQLLIIHKITHFICVPALYRLLLEQVKEEDDLKLRIITLAGERIASSLVKESLQLLPDVEIINEYGPTEASVVALFKRNVQPLNDIAIGRPIANMKAYILNEQIELVPQGIVGEICLSGPGIVEGYLHDTDLMRAVFVPHPFLPGELLYRTGDLGKWTENGEMICLGRKDAQIKLRGYRIELSEIENRLLAYPGVHAAAVLCEEIEGIPSSIIAYLECDSVQAKDIRSYLHTELPQYMIPARILKVGRMPLSENGKIDKKKLAMLEEVADLDTEFREPENDIEKLLCTIFAEVLQVTRVSTEDSFFDVGGHSLKATMLMARIQKTFGTNISIDHIFELQTVRALAAVIAAQDSAVYEPITPAILSESYPLSSAQKRTYAVHSLDNQSLAYNMPEALVIEGDLDQERLSHAFSSLVKRHEILRTTFKSIHGEPVQIVHPEGQPALMISSTTVKNVDSEIRQFIRPFDLEILPLFRAGLWPMENQKHLLLIDLHHIISDGGSVGIFIAELAALYNGLALPEIPLQYKDYSVWQNQQAGRDEEKQQEQYWLKQFDVEAPVLNLPYDHARPKLKSLEGGSVSFTIDAESTAALKKMASEHGVTMFMLLFAAYHLMLSKLSGQEDVVIGTPVSGRSQTELERTMGMFINIVPIRNTASVNLSFRSFLEQVKRTALGAFENQAFQLEELLKRLRLSRDPGRNPLFDTMFSLQNMPENRFDFQGLHFMHHAIEQNVSKFDLTLNGFEGGDGVLYFEMEYATSLFHQKSVEQFVRYYTHIVNVITKQPDITLSSVTLLPREELQQHWSRYGNSKEMEPVTLTLPEQFAMAAQQFPNHEALQMGDDSITYDALMKLVIQRSSGLIHVGVGSQKVVAVRLERSFDMIISFLAILHAGAIYLPIDPAFPADRAEYMLQDAQAVLLITNNLEDHRLEFDGATMLPVDLDHAADEIGTLQMHSEIEIRKSQMNDLAYVIYTSGTTGQPKGTALEHEGLANLYLYFHNELGIKPDDKILQFAPATFDISVWEFAMAFSTGASLCLVSMDTIHNPEQLEQYAEEAGVTVALFPPTYMNRLRPEKLMSLRILLTCGSEPSAQQFMHWGSRMRVVNAYGPTEATIVATAWEMDPGAQISVVPIGYPLPNVRICIIDASMNPVPAGVIGELCISGIGLAREYLNKPEITARQFVTTDMPGFERMYRTGDFVKQLPDGSIVYLGRVDNQLKIRGCRVEPKEIEAHVLNILNVEHAIVLPKPLGDSDRILAAYYTGELAPEPNTVKDILSNGLPGYMVPSIVLKLSEIPLTLHGKVDAKALNILSSNHALRKVSKRLPANAIEAEILKVFTAVLEIEGIGPDDKFSEVGGDSLSAMKVVFMLKEKNLRVEVKDLLLYQSASVISEQIQHRAAPVLVSHSASKQQTGQTPQLKELIHKVSQQHQEFMSHIIHNAPTAIIPINAMQIMHLSRSENVGTLIPIPTDSSFERVQQALFTVIEEQEMFRMIVSKESADSWILLSKPSQIVLPYIHIAGENAVERIKQLAQEQLHRPFDYDTPEKLLYRFILIENGNTGEKILVYASHHSLSDGFSCGLITEKLSHLLQSYQQSNPETSYMDFVRLMESGPRNISSLELNQYYKLPVYQESRIELENRIGAWGSESSHLSLEYTLYGNVPEEGWHFALQLISTFGKQFLSMDKLPIQLVSAGRHYGEHRFYHIVGNLIDYIPIVLSLDHSAAQMLEEIQGLTQLAGKHFIRFADLQDQISGQGIVLNYLGNIEHETQEDWAWDDRPAFAETAENYGISFYVRQFGDKLKVDIAFPFSTDIEALKLCLSNRVLPTS